MNRNRNSQSEHYNVLDMLRTFLKMLLEILEKYHKCKTFQKLLEMLNYTKDKL